MILVMVDLCVYISVFCYHNKSPGGKLWDIKGTFGVVCAMKRIGTIGEYVQGMCVGREIRVRCVLKCVLGMWMKLLLLGNSVLKVVVERMKQMSEVIKMMSKVRVVCRSVKGVAL